MQMIRILNPKNSLGKFSPFYLILPAMIFVFIVVVFPLLFSLYSSFTPYNLLYPKSLHVFIGFKNYIQLLTNSDFYVGFFRTLIVVALAINIEFLLGLAAALLINKITYNARLLRTLIMFPMMFSPILVGFLFKFMFNDNVGIINNILESLGVIKHGIPWLIQSGLALFSILSAEIWSSTSVFAILLLAGLMSIPKEPIEAAKIDGCSPLQSFRYVTLPYLRPFIYIAMCIRSLDIARAYDIVKIMTNGGPAGRTELLWTMIGKTGFTDSKMGLANAMGYISIILSVAFTFYFFKKLQSAKKDMGLVQ